MSCVVCVVKAAVFCGAVLRRDAVKWRTVIDGAAVLCESEVSGALDRGATVLAWDLWKASDGVGCCADGAGVCDVVVVVVCPQCERGMSWLQFSDHWSSSSTTCGWSRWNAYFVHIANFATLQPWLHVGSFTCRIFNSLHTHKGPVLLCARPRHRAMCLNFLAQGKSLPPAGIELGTFGLQRQRSESATLATAPARHTVWC